MPSSPDPPPPLRNVPYTLREALYGTHGLEPCVSAVTYAWSPTVRQRFERFAPIFDRPKQALQHLLELFIIHVCRVEVPSDPQWQNNLLEYLAAVSQHLIPAVQPLRSEEWDAVKKDQNGKRVFVPQTEEHYPRKTVDSTLVMDIISTYTSSFREKDIETREIAEMTGLMDEPAKTAVMAYAWFLGSFGIKNGWLRPYLSVGLGRRERPRNCPGGGDGRLDRSGEELHTLFGGPYLDRMGHLIWYTVRQAKLGEIIGRKASSYARGNNVRIHSSKDIAESIRIHRSQICNINRLDYRLWESWTHGARAIGPFSGLGNHNLAITAVRFEKPVLLEDALAVGYRLVVGVFINPNGKEVVVEKKSDSMYTAKTPKLKCPLKEAKGDLIVWHPKMKFS